MSRRLVLEWQALMCRMHALRKAFISVKGFYLQAEVHGVSVTWLLPHAASQVLPKDVDMRVMLTFLEFYHTLLRFVLYKLYNGLGLRYPPVVRPEKEKISAELADIIQELSGAQRSIEERISSEKESAMPPSGFI
jgi:pescadillo